MLMRPLTGEPLALDLLNTEWRDADRQHDHLATDEGLSTWLAEWGDAASPTGDGRARAAPPGPALGADTLSGVRAALVAARAAVRGVLEGTDDAASRAALNAVLSRGRMRRGLGEAGPQAWVEVADAAWEPGWRAAADLLDLLERAPQRVRRCGNPACVLYFLDTSKNGSRRWCSMATCGNREKARRSYRRAARASVG